MSVTVNGTNVLSSAPSVYPITASEVRRNSPSIYDNTHDLQLTTEIIPYVVDFVEQRAGRSFITQTRIQYHDRFFPELRLQYGPVQSISSVSYVDTTGTSQTLASTVYRLDTVSKPGRLTEELNQSWPAIADVTNAITITYVSGYGTTASTVPIVYRQAMIALATFWFEHPLAFACGDMGNVLNSLDALIATEGAQCVYA